MFIGEKQGPLAPSASATPLYTMWLLVGCEVEKYRYSHNSRQRCRICPVNKCPVVQTLRRHCTSVDGGHCTLLVSARLMSNNTSPKRAARKGKKLLEIPDDECLVRGSKLQQPVVYYSTLYPDG